MCGLVELKSKRDADEGDTGIVGGIITGDLVLLNGLMMMDGCAFWYDLCFLVIYVRRT